MSQTVAMEWRVCARQPQYEVSEFGDVRRCVAGHNRPIGYRLKGSINSDGYLAYNFKDADGASHLITAYRLVAEAFISPPPTPMHEVAHNTGSRVDCYYRNLRWATRKENDDDRIVHGTTSRGTNNGHAKITEADVHDIRREYRRVKADRVKGGLVALEERYGLHRATVIGIATGKSWKHVPFQNEA